MFCWMNRWQSIVNRPQVRVSRRFVGGSSLAAFPSQDNIDHVRMPSWSLVFLHVSEMWICVSCIIEAHPSQTKRLGDCHFLGSHIC